VAALRRRSARRLVAAVGEAADMGCWRPRPGRRRGWFKRELAGWPVGQTVRSTVQSALTALWGRPSYYSLCVLSSLAHSTNS
jgi:hypothetical protein